MNNLKRLGNRIDVAIKADEDGFIGRECPNPECRGYFKVTFGTGLQGKNLPCHCPYCGYIGSHNTFWSKEQVEYVQSIAHRQIMNAVYNDMKSLEFKSKPPRGGFGIGFSIKLKPGRPVPIRYYREKKLETKIVCNNCTLRYAIYGVFAFCPDCGIHNSLQILEMNLELFKKQISLSLSNEVDDELKEILVNDALENIVSSFDGFGREICKIRAGKSQNIEDAKNVRFQNLEQARRKILNLFGIDIKEAVDSDEWDFALKEFQKRHLLAHKMGVIDKEYLEKSQDTEAVIRRKIRLNNDEIIRLIGIIQKISNFMVDNLPKP